MTLWMLLSLEDTWAQARGLESMEASFWPVTMRRMKNFSPYARSDDQIVFFFSEIYNVFQSQQRVVLFYVQTFKKSVNCNQFRRTETARLGTCSIQES